MISKCLERRSEIPDLEFITNFAMLDVQSNMKNKNLNNLVELLSILSLLSVDSIPTQIKKEIMNKKTYKIQVSRNCKKNFGDKLHWQDIKENDQCKYWQNWLGNHRINWLQLTKQA